jgi:hypothetical protein
VEPAMKMYLSLSLMWKRSKSRSTWWTSTPILLRLKMKKMEVHRRRGGGDFKSNNEPILWPGYPYGLDVNG